MKKMTSEVIWPPKGHKMTSILEFVKKNFVQGVFGTLNKARKLIFFIWQIMTWTNCNEPAKADSTIRRPLEAAEAKKTPKQPW